MRFQTFNLLCRVRGLISLGACTAALAGCSLAPAVTRNSLEYDDTIEDVSNKSLVTNILRGRDSAPLYLTDLSQIRGGMTASASTQASLPYGPSFGTVTAGPFSASSTPSFDISPSNTKKFYQGIMNPISKGLFAYYVERDRSSVFIAPLFYMLVSAIDETRGNYTKTHYAGDGDFYKITDQWLDIKKPARVIKSTPKDAGAVPTVATIDAKALIDATNAGLDVKVDKITSRIRIGKKTSDTTICFPMDGGYVPVEVEQNSTVSAPAGDVLDQPSAAPDACAKLPRSKGYVSHAGQRFKVHLRSVEQIFYFLGSTARPERKYHPLFDIPDEKDVYELNGCRRVPFFLSSQPVEYERFSVTYRGETFYVANNRRRVPCEGDPRHDQPDYTMATLAILNALLNLNRDAEEIPTTKAVQAVGPK